VAAIPSDINFLNPNITNIKLSLGSVVIMDEKLEHQELLLENDQPAREKNIDFRLPMPAIVLLAIGVIYGVFQGVSILCMPMQNENFPLSQMSEEVVWGASKIPLEAHIMLK